MTGEEIRIEREKRGLSQEALAREIGTTQQTVQRIEKEITQNSLYKDLIIDFFDGNLGKSNWSMRLEERIARASEPKRTEKNGGTPTSKKAKVIINAEKDINTQIGLMPVFTTRVDDAGDLIIWNKPIDLIARPEPLLRIDDAYGIYVANNVMSPAIKSGEVIFVHPFLPPLIGEDHLFSSGWAGELDAKCVIGNLTDFNNFFFEIDQYNPSNKIDLGRSEFYHCHRIVGKFTRR